MILYKNVYKSSNVSMLSYKIVLHTNGIINIKNKSDRPKTSGNKFKVREEHELTIPWLCLHHLLRTDGKIQTPEVCALPGQSELSCAIHRPLALAARLTP